MLQVEAGCPIFIKPDGGSICMFEFSLDSAWRVYRQYNCTDIQLSVGDECEL